MPPGKCPYLHRCDKYAELTGLIDRLRDSVERLYLRNRELEKENERLRNAQSGGKVRAAEALPFGSSTPSSKIPVKANSTEENRMKVGGRPKGHAGCGRRAVPDGEADEVAELPRPRSCPSCGHRFERWVPESRTVVDEIPARRIVRNYTAFRAWCPKCGKWHRGKVPGVMPRFAFSNGLLAQTMVDHYWHGIPMRKLARRMKVGKSALVQASHRLAELLRPAVEPLAAEFRRAREKHADETAWPCDGKNGYAWGFFTRTSSVYRFRGTRAATVPAEVFGEGRHTGVLGVDRYAAYNNSWKGKIQYCLEHMKRNLDDLLAEKPDDGDRAAFIPRLLELLRDAMTLRNRKRGRKAEYDAESRRIRDEILAIAAAPVKDKKLAEYFGLISKRRDRFFQWVCHPEIPAENNLAERRLRPLVTARKVSFGSQSEKGLATRETLMAIVDTLSLRYDDPVARLAEALDAIAQNPKANVAKALWR